MSSSQEILCQAFPDKTTPQVSSGITHIESCLKHVNETFKASKVYFIASGSLTRNTTFTSDLQKALGPKLAKTQVGMTPHTMMSEVLEVVEDARNVEADCIVTLGGGGFSDAAKLISFISYLSLNPPECSDQLQALANNVHNKSDLQKLPYIGKEKVYHPLLTVKFPSFASQLPSQEANTQFTLARQIMKLTLNTNFAHLSNHHLSLSSPALSPERPYLKYGCNPESVV
jgi:hypothetical protein